jgi:hypothetical protein
MSARKWILGLVAGVLLAAAHGSADARLRRGCSDPCGPRYVAVMTDCRQYVTGYSQPAAPACQPLDTGSATLLQVELVPTYVTEKRIVCTTEYRDEQRQRVVSVPRTVPISEERYRVNTVMVPKTETKTIEFTTTVPVQSMATKTYKIKVPVYRDVEEAYTARVPVLKEVDETYTAKVPVLRDVEFTYTVNVPYPITTTVQRNVTSAVPVVKTRTISQCLPETKTKTVTVDRGHWENRLVEVAAYGSRRRGCGCGTMVVCQRFWVPNCVAEEVTTTTSSQKSVEVEYLAYEQQVTAVPYECTSICYRPESRTGTKKQVGYEDRTLTRKRTLVEYVNEARTRVKKELSFQEEERSETYPVVSYTQEKKTKDLTYTIYVPESKVDTYTATRQDTIQDQRIETYTARVAVPATKEIEVQVCKMIPKVVSINIGNPCRSTSGQPCMNSWMHNHSMPTQAPVQCCQ